MIYEIQRYNTASHIWFSICTFKDLSLAQSTYSFFVEKFDSDIIRLICVLDFEEVL